ncbi:MAG: hypothetical protein RLZZ557_1979 [Bacteroidota bacterium]|jgi:hypothetical protein
MGSELVIIPVLFGTIFGIVYLFISSRHKERMALIEKGTDASIFYAAKTGKSRYLPIIVLNFAVLLTSIGVAIFIGALLSRNFDVDESVAYPGTIFLISGIGMYIGFKKTIAWNRQD